MLIEPRGSPAPHAWAVGLFRVIATIGLVMLLTSCVSDPVAPAVDRTSVDSTHGVLVANEGLWHGDNATLTFVDRSSGRAVQDWFGRRNPGMRLGDLANSIAVHDGRAWIAMTGSHNVEVIELPTARSLGRVRLGSGGPTEVAFVDDSTGFVTLVNEDAVAEFDTRTLQVRRHVPVGPAPEGIAVAGGRLFVANSGYGFLRWREPAAGSISVIDPFSGRVERLLDGYPNVISLLVAAGGNRLYALYGLPHADSLGGVVELDVATLVELKRWEIRGAGVAGEMALDTRAGLMYAIDGAGDLLRIDLAQHIVEKFLGADSYSSMGWYSVGVDPATGEIHLGIVSRFTESGEVLVVDRAGRPVARHGAGIFPGAFAFY